MSKEKKEKKSSEEIVTEKVIPPEEENPEIEVEAPKSELELVKEELAHQKDLHLRTAAEYANFRTRTEKEKLEIYANAKADTIKNILPIADSIDMALLASGEATDDYKKGIELIKAQIEKAFSALGIESFGERGEEFDPQIHSAIGKIDDEELEENKIALVLQKGYKCGDKIIRYCMVQVAN